MVKIKRDYIDSVGSHVCVIEKDGEEGIYLLPTEERIKQNLKENERI